MLQGMKKEIIQMSQSKWDSIGERIVVEPKLN